MAYSREIENHQVPNAGAIIARVREAMKA
jgi:hypothetical protein